MTEAIRQRLKEIADRISPTIGDTFSLDTGEARVEGRILAVDYTYLLAAAALSVGLRIYVKEDNRIGFAEVDEPTTESIQ